MKKVFSTPPTEGVFPVYKSTLRPQPWRAMRTFKNSLFLLIAAAMLTASGKILAAQQDSVPENDYGKLQTKFRHTPKDVSAIRAWLEQNLEPSANPETMFSRQCLEFVRDVSASTWGYDESITAQQVEQKWRSHFDLRNAWDHPFENGNCGWGSRKLANFEYLGELNGGDWFRLTITGGCVENDFSESLTRVIKVVSQNGKYQITNFISP